MKIFLTGGTGLLGNNVIRQALEAGHQIVAISRDSSVPQSLQGLDIELVHSDMENVMEHRNSLQNIDIIIHSAGHIHLGWTKRQEALRTNEQGTRCLIELARYLECRFLHVSTVDTLAIPAAKQVADEETSGDGQIASTYVVTKRAGEAVVTSAMADGLDAMILHPSFMLGPWDWKPSSGRMIQAVDRTGWIPLAPSGGCSVGDARETARGTLLAVEKWTRGRHYILAGHNITYLQLWQMLAERLHRKKPIGTIGPALERFLGVVGDVGTRMTGKESDLNSAALRMGSQYHWYSSDRAKQELGFRFRAMEESIDDAIRWLRDYGYLRKK